MNARYSENNDLDERPASFTDAGLFFVRQVGRPRLRILHHRRNRTLKPRHHRSRDTAPGTSRLCVHRSSLWLADQQDMGNVSLPIHKGERRSVRFIIEFDGVIFDLRAVYYEAHRTIAAEVGWSRLDEPTFWRLTRTKGRDADLLPGAAPVKLKQYFARFTEKLEDDDMIARYTPQPDVDGVLDDLAQRGTCCATTLGGNLAARHRALDQANLTRFFTAVEKLDPDPRRRPAELKVLAAGDPRTVVVASTDYLIRAAGQADLFTVGVSSGFCAARRLHQAGADIVYPNMDALAESLALGGQDLIRAGLLPQPGN